MTTNTPTDNTTDIAPEQLVQINMAQVNTLLTGLKAFLSTITQTPQINGYNAAEVARLRTELNDKLSEIKIAAIMGQPVPKQKEITALVNEVSAQEAYNNHQSPYIEKWYNHTDNMCKAVGSIERALAVVDDCLENLVEAEKNGYSRERISAYLDDLEIEVNPDFYSKRIKFLAHIPLHKIVRTLGMATDYQYPDNITAEIKQVHEFCKSVIAGAYALYGDKFKQRAEVKSNRQLTANTKRNTGVPVAGLMG